MDNVGFIWRSVLSNVANGLVSRPCLLFVASRREGSGKQEQEGKEKDKQDM